MRFYCSIAACASYLTSWCCKMADSDNNLSMSEEYEDKGLREVYVLVKKPNTTSKVWAHFGLKGDKDGLPDPAEVEKPICRHCHKAIWAK